MADPIMPAALQASPALHATAKTRSTAEDFESVFLGQLAKLMMDNVNPGEFSGGNGEDIFRGVMAEQIGKEMARQGGIGLAPAVLEQMLKLQEQGDA